MDKVIFFHMNQLGDLLFSLPVLKAVKNEFNSKTYSVVKSDLAPLLTSSNLADEIISKDENFVKIIRKEKFNKAILFSESPSSLISAFFSGVKERIGFNTASLSFLLTKKVQRTGVPSLFNNRKLGIASGLQLIRQDYTNCLNIPKENLNNVQKWFESNKLNVSKTIAISINASRKRKDKCLPENKWIEVVNILSSKGFTCIFLGAHWEKENLTKVSKQCRTETKLFISKNILDSAAFLKISSLFIGIDSGAMHLAASVGTKCIAIFGYTDPMQIGPMPFERHVIIKNNNIDQITCEDIVSKIL
ncbi:MAG: glycosyltransferase family 9 protein [Endomicrobium sp.]|jgi:heptosyltransferase-2|nr:glycosyltransferase family 9 protein [Endomicrobium sp.]